MTSPLFYSSAHNSTTTPTSVVEVLLIEDNPPDAEIVVEMLWEEVSASAMNFTYAQRLDEALHLLNEHKFSIILADLSLPDAYGLEVVIRLQSAAPSLPIVVLSGGTDTA